MEYIKYEKGDLSFEYKNFLNLVEFRTLISEAVDAYINGEPTNDNKRIIDNISGFDYNLISGEERFYSALCILCVKDYTNELFEKIFNNQVQLELVEKIANAKLAYETYEQIISKYGSVENVFERKLTELLNKIPEKEKIEKILKTLPKEWDKVNKQYNSITKEEGSK